MTHKQYIISSTMEKVVFQILSINVNISVLDTEHVVHLSFELLNLN